MPDVSIIIPARKEQFLAKTVEAVLEKAKSDIEVIVVHDGGVWGDPVPEDPRIVNLVNEEWRGLRNCTNQAAEVATGEYILRVDAHCQFDQGFDVKLLADMKDNWIVVPTRHVLEASTWEINERKTAPINHFYICYPTNPQDWGGISLSGRRWRAREEALVDSQLDELMMFQGSCWFMKRDYFFKQGLLNNRKYGPYGKGAAELLLRCWLTGGQVMRNKNTWYAHLFKGKKYRRRWPVPKHMLRKGGKAINQWLIYQKAYSKQIYDFKYLIDRFAPVPTWENVDWSDPGWVFELTQ